MAISSISSTTDATSTTGSKKTTLNQEDFYNLLAAEMKYQDPLNPMDTYQMASMTTQMSTVENLNNIYKTVSEIAASQDAFGTTALIGKTIEAQGTSGTVTGIYFEDGSTYVQVGSKLIALEDITAITSN